MDPLASDKLFRIPDPDGGYVLAWACACGEDKDDTYYVVEWDEPIEGIKLSVCHESCLKVVEDE